MKFQYAAGLIASVILFSFIAVSIAVFIDYQNLIDSFKSNVSDVDRRFTQQVASTETVLVSLIGLHHASDDLNQAELTGFSEEMLKASPFIDAIIGLEKVEHLKVNTFENRMRKQGYIGLNIKRRNNRDMSFYLPVNFVEPMTPDSAGILGTDFRSLPDFENAIELAISSGGVTTSKIVTTSEIKEPSILMFKAIYLGRYPPDTNTDRLAMINGLVALKIDVGHFMKYLELNSLKLVGSIENSPGNKKTDNNDMYEFTLDVFQYAKDITIYNQHYRLTLMRKIRIDMINQKQVVIIWIISMMFLSVILFFLKKRKESEDEIKHLAYFDSLTDLPNRESFKEKLSLALAESFKNKTSGAILFMDVDEFKRINDSLGHDIGDELLKQISKRLSSFMRQSDVVSLDVKFKDNGVVTRLGGDEFTVLLTDIKSVDSVGAIANRIQGHISQPFNLNGHEVYVTSSIGIAVFPHDGDDVDRLLKYADTAMYHAKEMGKNNYQFYFENLSSKNEHRLSLEGKLRQAIEKNEFLLYYQPQIDSKTNEIVAAEALIRWNQSELGMIFPDDFISLAEETGQIFEIGEWVVREACRQNKVWQDAGYKPIKVAVNLSSLQFMQNNLNVIISDVLSEIQLDPQYLELEITESIMMKNVNETISIIKKFTDINVGVSVDDFGTGYSSLSYLKKFPLDSLKIDKSFVMDIPEDNDDMMITSAIISMAKSLNLKVIAEGVESQGQVEFLKEHDCDLMQGYYFSRPVPASEFEKAWLNGGV